ncbi:DNA cytosine methyltransferase [Marinobacter sp. tcs-11]|uniref:DNA cytosine methyltransferase n=1 Tax=Marinobacter sp. tcs-11 TaxID=1742860 RepID=UPI0025797C4D|nr:DNA cytosine methyltransferase [Marinobacter sp. tcs-11]
MTTILAPTVKINRGKPRIWLEGQRLARGAFTQDTRYNISFKNGTVTLKACKDGDRKVSAYKDKPIIDLNSKEVGEWFPVGTKLRAVVRRGRIVIRRLANSMKALKRDRDLLTKLLKGEPLNVVSMYHGAGVMSRSLHDGWRSAGIKTRTLLAAEIDGRYLDASLKANADLFDSSSVLVNAPVQDMEFDHVPSADLMEIGLPCSGQSKAGRSKRKLASAEEHPEAGALFFTSLEWIKKFQPAAAIIECTPELLNSPSMAVIRSVLASWKYTILVETTLNGCDFGALENRDRAVVIAMSRDLAKAGMFNLADIKPLRVKEEKLADVLEPISEDDDRWAIHTYLEEKALRDAKKGSGFQRQLYTGEESYINTVTRGYARIRSTDPHIMHPTKPRYTRLLTVAEHAAVKALPKGWIETCELANTVAHEVLGQSVIYPLFKAIGAALGHNLRTLAETLLPTMTQHIEPTALAA